MSSSPSTSPTSSSSSSSPALAPPDRPFEPFAPTAQEPFDPRRLCHLLRRAAFGASPKRLAERRDQPVGAVLDWLFDYDPAHDPFDEMVIGLEGFIDLTRPGAVASYWFYRILNSPYPLQERVALFWHNRFATGAGKVENGRLMHGQVQTFRRLGLGSFRELLVAVGRDPAMLVWLDGQSNRKGKPNENYAREVMELFCLGLGHYTERDVKELARCFTGWRLAEESAVFDPKQFDDGEKQILGQAGHFDSAGAVDVLLAQPAAPRHLARNLLREFVHPEPLEAHVAHYAGRLVDDDWDVKRVLREMLASRLFFSDWAYRARIKSPVELTAGAALAIGGKVSTEFLREQSTRLGQNLLNPPNVKGWPGEQTWINASTVLLRFNFAMQMATQRQREFVRPTELAAWLKQNELASAEDVVDHFADVLLDGNIPQDARLKLISYMNRDQKNDARSFKVANETINTKVRGVLHMMMTMPQYQLA